MPLDEEQDKGQLSTAYFKVALPTGGVPSRGSGLQSKSVRAESSLLPYLGAPPVSRTFPGWSDTSLPAPSFILSQAPHHGFWSRGSPLPPTQVLTGTSFLLSLAFCRLCFLPQPGGEGRLVCPGPSPNAVQSGISTARERHSRKLTPDTAWQGAWNVPKPRS